MSYSILVTSERDPATLNNIIMFHILLNIVGVRGESGVQLRLHTNHVM